VKNQHNISIIQKSQLVRWYS